MCQAKIDSLVENINHYLEIFSQRNQYGGPSIYFHNRIIDVLQRTPIDRLLNSLWFSEYIYSVLVSWGMHRMDGGAQLKDFPLFHNVITNFIQNLIPISHLTITELTETHFETIVNLFDNNSVMRTTPRLVGNSKTMHHILPNLIPPIDNKSTLWFFNNPNMSESETLIYVIKKYQYIYTAINWEEVNYTGPMKTTKIKLIDNAIIGFRFAQADQA
jgi:hypothetical protein